MQSRYFNIALLGLTLSVLSPGLIWGVDSKDAFPLMRLVGCMVVKAMGKHEEYSFNARITFDLVWRTD